MLAWGGNFVQQFAGKNGNLFEKQSMGEEF
jgi:hypothetical protein